MDETYILKQEGGKSIEEYIFSASYAQKRLWLTDQLIEKNKEVYNIASEIDIDGTLNIKYLEKSLNKIIERHEILRTFFEMNNDGLQQIVRKEFSIELDIIDLQNLSEEVVNKQISEISKREASYHFELENLPLLKATLIKVNEEKFKLFITMHHIISDGWSIGVFIKELSTIYQSYCLKKELNLPEISIQYGDYAEWERDQLQEEKVKKQVDYWKNYLSGDLPVLELPADYPRPSNQTFEGSLCEFKISQQLTKSLKKLSNEVGVTLYVTLLASFNALLNRLTSKEDIIVGTPVANRKHQELESLIGYFVNTLPIRANLSGNLTFKQLVEQIHNRVKKAFFNQDLPFEKIVEDLKVERSKSFSPLFQVMFVFQNMPMQKLEMPNLKLNVKRNQNNTAKYDLILEMTEKNEEIVGSFEYNTDLFKQETILRMINHINGLIEEVVKNPEIRIKDINLITEKEKNQILYDFNQTKKEMSQSQTLIGLFELQVKKEPYKIAIQTDEEHLTYQEVNQKANQFANLLRERGMKPNQVVGILIERSIDMIIGILGILKAGGAYMPISPEFPEDRIQYMIQNSEAQILCTTAKFQEKINHLNSTTLYLDNPEWHINNSENLSSVCNENDLAYVMYTSGSTGRPKGVMVEHHSVINRIDWMIKKYSFTEKDIMLQKTPFIFDVSVPEIFTWFFIGGCVHLLSHDGEKEPDKIIESIEKHRITTVHFVPSMFNIFLKSLENSKNINRLSTLKRVFTSGEALLPNQVAQFRDIVSRTYGTELYNLYGPTEATVEVSYYDCPMGTNDVNIVPIGRPIQNVQLLILDQNGQLQPIGVPGELCISGSCLARGYINQKVLTNEKFVPNPYYKDQLMYRTGDLASWLPDGNIRYLGRIDHQVKIRGYRIELGEVEQLIAKLPRVKEVAISVRKDNSSTERLVAYVIGDSKLDLKELRSDLKNSLPDYMVPSAFIIMDEFPLTPTGKLNRKKLPELSREHFIKESYIEPKTKMEKDISDIWKETLGLNSIGVADNFFELGGNSLTATKLMWLLNEKLKVNISLQAIFNHPTISDFIKHISQKSNSIVKNPLFELQPRENKFSYPMTYAQKGIWFQDQINPQNIAYNIPVVLKLTGKLDLAVLEEGFTQVVKRHETLRSAYINNQGHPKQVICEPFSISLNKETVKAEELLEHIKNEVSKPFVLEEGLILRVKIFELNTTEHILTLTLHHIIGDAISITNLIHEVFTIYTNIINLEEIELPQLGIQFADYAAWQQKWIESEDCYKQLDYWKKKLKNAPIKLSLPLDYSRPNIQDFSGESIVFEIPDEIIKALHQLCKQERVTLYMLLLSAWKILLYRYTKQTDIIVGTNASGRNSQTEHLIGVFINTLAIRTNLDSNPTFLEYVNQVKETVIDAFKHQELPFEYLLNALRVYRNSSNSPLTQVFLAYHKIPNLKLPLEQLKINYMELESKTVKSDIILEIIDNDDTVMGRFEYATSLFTSETINEFINHYLQLLKDLIKDPEKCILEIPYYNEEMKRGSSRELDILKENNRKKFKAIKPKSIALKERR
ncbi:non-ribosomal peptide synthetase [Bacillus atrophaeus]|uniref:non-ribosomal peptide synthetase n=1 Tax=Bacillus atrophaeus TaxID=1452 RepID=UPI00227FF40E|nr:non-ribosomal peptide synthetase [Bacillus atrophaeus]MCY8834837.1 amino acid adenylation domain-containing protein [Bacillus atrophaeus]